MPAALPVVRVVGPGRNIGKTWLAARLIRAFAARGYSVGAIKRSHHPVPIDRPGSDTDLFATAGASPVVYSAGDGTLTRAPVAGTLAALTSALPPTTDLVVVEGFKSDTLGARVEIVPAGTGARVCLWTMDNDLVLEEAIEHVEVISDALECILSISPAGDEPVRDGVRRAAVSHGHRCPGLTLGVRMTLHAAALLGFPLDPAPRDLEVEIETARCASDAIAALTGCTIGSRRLHVAEYGKLAATFTLAGRAVRIAARSGLREAALASARCDHAAHAQDDAYRTMHDAALFTVKASVTESAPPAAVTRIHGSHPLCGACGEEVAVPSIQHTPDGLRCIPCAAGHARTIAAPATIRIPRSA